jgi:hypothetical protein
MTKPRSVSGVWGGCRARVYIGAERSNMDHAHVACLSRLQQPMIWERPEPASCDASIKGSVKRSVFLCSKKISSALRLNSANRRPRASWRVVSSRDKTSERVALLFSSHSLTKWCNTAPYMLVYIPPNIPYGTKLSSNRLPLCSQKLRLHVTWTHTHGLSDF